MEADVMDTEPWQTAREIPLSFSAPPEILF